jgi:carbon-monoxide dehydrogenase medium subunit
MAMLNLRQIFKPTTLKEALALLEQPGAVALAGGTQLMAAGRRDVEAVVDLGALGLSYIRESSGAVVIGATTPLADLAESPLLQAMANGVAAQAAHRSAGSILRNQGSAAGTLMAEPDGILAVALIALDARVELAGKNTRIVPAAEFVSRPGDLVGRGLVTQISLPIANPRASLQTVARTPRDRPIVAVCAAAKMENGIARQVRIAMGGTAPAAGRASEAEKLLEGTALEEEQIERAAGLAAQSVSPRGDFRGSAEYRRAMVQVLTRRALKELQAPGA